MQLKLKPGYAEGAEPCGILIRGSKPEDWLRALRGSGIALPIAECYAVPGLTAASVWGCLILTDVSKLRDLAPSITFVRPAGGRLYIPLDGMLYPALSATELSALLKDECYLLHPLIGMVPLEERLFWEALIEMPNERTISITVPVKPIFLPQIVRRFELASASAEEDIQDMERRAVPEQKKFNDKPLGILEHLRLALYRKLFSKTDMGVPEKTMLFKKLQALMGRVLPSPEKMQDDFEDLERRNSSEIDKLLKMLRDNPQEALKYAIPLGDGSERGGQAGSIKLLPRWNSFSLSGSTGRSTSGNGIISGDHQFRLLAEYKQAAQTLLDKGEYEKAAFVYMKLLKNYMAAAQTLEKGGLYADAAAIHLKYNNNKKVAADCYVKANMLSKAIELYTELGNYETAGDLYMRLNKRAEAMNAYGKVADEHINANRIVKAAALMRDKMDDTAGAQTLLISGWRNDIDAYNCIHNYLSNTTSPAALQHAVISIYAYDVNDKNAALFLRALKHETGRGQDLDNHLRAIAIEIIAMQIVKEPTIISELQHFAKGNALIVKDIMRYNTTRRVR